MALDPHSGLNVPTLQVAGLALAEPWKVVSSHRDLFH